MEAALLTHTHLTHKFDPSKFDLLRMGHFLNKNTLNCILHPIVRKSLLEHRGGVFLGYMAIRNVLNYTTEVQNHSVEYHPKISEELFSDFNLFRD